MAQPCVVCFWWNLCSPDAMLMQPTATQTQGLMQGELERTGREAARRGDDAACQPAMLVL